MDERGELFRDARNFYDLAYGAVHSGQTSSKWEGEK
jgi:hypothetical protein